MELTENLAITAPLAIRDFNKRCRDSPSTVLAPYETGESWEQCRDYNEGSCILISANVAFGRRLAESLSAFMDAAHPTHRVTEPTNARCHKVKADEQWYEWDELVNSKDVGFKKEQLLYVGYENPAPNHKHYERIMGATFKTGKW